MDTSKIEEEAVGAVRKYIDKSPKFKSNITVNDKTTIWDGEINVYRGEVHTVDNFYARVPLQVKGTTKIPKNFRIKRGYVEGYKSERGTAFFVVQVDANYNATKVLYSILSLNKINTLLLQTTKTIRIDLQEVPADPNAFEKEVFAFAKERNGEKTENSSPKEVADLVDGFKEIKDYLDEIDDKNTKIELELLLNGIINLKDDGTIGWRDRFIYYSRKAIDLAINNVKDYDCLNLRFALGAYLHKQKLYHLVEDYYLKTLEECRKRAKVFPSWYEKDVATTLNNLAALHDDLKRYTEAEEEYKKALEIRRKLAAANPDAYNGDVAMTLNNLAALHYNLTRYTEAEKEYKEALEIRRKLAATNPDAYNGDVAMTLNNLANLHDDLKRYTEAEEEYKKALEIRRKLAAANPDAYNGNVAMTLNNLANLHSDLTRYPEAEEEYKEALEKYRKLAATNPDAYNEYVAMTFRNLAILHAVTDRKAEAEEYAEEALGIYKQLAKRYPQIWNRYVEKTQRLLDYINAT